jgi:hypothetical protein
MNAVSSKAHLYNERQAFNRRPRIGSLLECESVRISIKTLGGNTRILELEILP